MLSWKFSSLELVPRYLLASPSIIDFPVLGGWYDVLCTYNCLFVGLMCVLTSSIPSCRKRGPLYTVTSRNTISWLLHSWVNLMVLWRVLMSSMYCLNSASEPFHMTNMSSINLLHSRILSFPLLRSCFSRLPIEILA